MVVGASMLSSLMGVEVIVVVVVNLRLGRGGWCGAGEEKDDR